MRHILVLALLLVSHVCAQAPLALGKMADASDMTKKEDYSSMTYMYAPTSIYENGIYHMFVCSSGEPVIANNVPNNTFTPGRGISWDHIRHMTSRNGQDWSAAKVVLKPVAVSTTTSFNDQAACDPSIVKASDGYYYLFYGGSYDGPGGGIFVSRSLNLAGPYEKLKINNTWAIDPPDPKVIVAVVNPTGEPCGEPLNALGNCPSGTKYGVGQPTVVFQGGEFHMWYVDRSNGQGSFYTHATSVAGSWAAPQAVQPHGELGEVLPVGALPPGDIKYNTVNSRFEWYYMIGSPYSSYAPPYQRPSMRRMFSTNRVDWFDQGVSISLENNAHNMGIIAKRADGILNPGEGYIVIYGGPEDAIDNNPQYGLISGATGNKWGYWDILGKAVDYTNLGSYSIPSGWQWGGMGLHSRTISGGDYDGDGLTDRAIYDVNTGAWFVIPSKTNTAGMIGIPWNNTLGIPYQPGFEILVGDFDGDGKTDPGMVDVVNGRWYILGSKNGYSQGIPNNANGVLGGIPWGWQWAGAGANNKPVSGADYDGDGRADRATVNVATGAWYVIPSNTATAGFAGIPWGSNLSVPYQAGFHVLVGDFDGDGKTDPGILNAANGRWYIRRSGDGYQGGIGPFTWGWQWLGTNSNHRPVIADYDGDGKADVAVMEKNAGLWFVHSSHKSLYLNSVQHYDTIPWAQAVVPGYNLADWEPVLGNFDGRTRADVSVVNRNGGYWYIRGSRNPYTVGITLTTFDLP